MGKIMLIKEEDLIPKSASQTPVYPVSVSKASFTVYEESYPGTPELKGKQTIDVETDLKNLWAIIGNMAVKPETLISIPYDGETHPLKAPSTARYTIDYVEEEYPSEVGSYHFIATLKTGYTWRDLTTDPVEITMVIYTSKIQLTSGIVTINSLTYTGAAQNLVRVNRPDGYTGKILMNITGETASETIPQATEANTYKVEVVAEDDEHFKGLSYSLSVTIKKKGIAYPKLTSSIVYTGSEINAKYLDGTIVSEEGTTSYEILSESVIKATDVKEDGYNIVFKPRDNYQWSSTSSSEAYTATWFIAQAAKSMTWTVGSSYNVGQEVTELGTITDVEVAYYFYKDGVKGKQIELPYTFTMEDVGSTNIKAEYIKDYPNYKALGNSVSSLITIGVDGNYVTWDSDIVTNIMFGKEFTLKAKATSGKIVFRNGSLTGEVVGGQPQLIDGWWVSTWKPGASGSYNIYAMNTEWDTEKYKQASAVKKVFTVTAQVKNVITWAGDTTVHYVGETITLDSTAVTNSTYEGKQGSVAYYRGDYSTLEDTELPTADPLVSPYTIVNDDLYGLTITAFNIGYNSEYTSAAKKVIKSIKVANRTGAMTIGEYQPTAYIDVSWFVTVTIPSGTIDFRLKTTDGYRSLAGDSRAVITPLGNNQYQLEYKFLGPSGRLETIMFHNEPATGYAEPSNQDTTISIGIQSLPNSIIITNPTSEEISVTIGDKISASAYATSGYIQFYNGDPDNTTNPGVLITEGYVSGISGEPCSISNYAITKATTLIYVKNVGYDGAYAQAATKYFKVLASSLVPLNIKFDGGSTGTASVGDTLTYSAKVYDNGGTEVSGFTFKYYINDVETPSGTYVVTGSDPVSVKVEVTNPSAISGYIVSPSTSIKTFTIKETVAYIGYSADFNDFPTTDAEVEAFEATSGFTKLNTENAPYNSPKTFWVAVKNGHTGKFTDEDGDEALPGDDVTTTSYVLHYQLHRGGYAAILNGVIN